MTESPIKQSAVTEFYRPIAAESLKIGNTELSVEATEEECAKLAERFGVLSIDHLDAHVRLTRKGQGTSLRVTVKGELSARLTQTCIITLDPIAAKIKSEFTAIFDVALDDVESDIEIDSDNDNIIEPIINGEIDIGELVAQNLAMEIDPFPRAEGADSSKLSLKSEDSSSNPFSALEKLKNKQN